ncbi:MAG: GAF domain-containing protein [Anaerolineae bacterium]|nr:GAF domain-containing protein [Anaerolineae bacterium]
MDKIAATIRSQYDSLIEAYNQHWQALSDAVLLPNQASVEMVSQMMKHLADTTAVDDDSEFAQRWVADALAEGITPATLQINLTALEQTLMPLATTVETATVLWQVFTRMRTEAIAQTAKQSSVSIDERLDEVLSIARAAYWEFDIATQTFTFNDQFYSLFHTSAAQEGGYHMPVQTFVEKFVYPEDIPLVATTFQGVIETTAPNFLYERDFRVIHSNAEQRIHLARFRAKKDEQGQIVKIVGATQDITEQKWAEKQLRENEARLVEATSIAKLYYWEFDRITQIFTFSPKYYKLLNIPITEETDFTMPLAEYFQKYVPPESAKSVGQEIERVLASSESDYSQEIESQNVTTDGRVIPIMIRFRIIRGEDGIPIKTIGVNQDITEQKAVEAQLQKQYQQMQETLEVLQENEARLSQATSFAKLYEWELDFATQTFTFSPEYYKLLNIPITDKTDFKMSIEEYAQKYVPPGSGEVVSQEIERVLASSESDYSRKIESENMTTDGRIVPIMVRFRLTRDKDGNPIKTIGANQDITEYKAVEAELRKRALELAAVSEISTQIGQISDPAEMLQQVADLTKERFGLYHAHIYVLDEAGETLNLIAGAGEAGRTMVAEGWSIPFEHQSSLVALTARKRSGTIANDVQGNPDFLPNPLLPDTRSEMAVPILAGEKLLGVLDVQGDVVDRFMEQDIQIETTLASQVAIALQNARQYQQTQEALEELRRSEEVLRENEARLSQATAAAKLYEWELDFATQTFTFSPEYYKLLNIPITDETDFKMSVEDYAQKYVKNPEVVGREVERVLASTESNYSQEIEDYNVTTDGRLIPIMVRFRVVRDKEGNPIRTVGANQDITEQKRVQEILAKQADDLQKVAEISTRIATTHNEARLLQEVVDLTKDRIGLYHAHLYLLDERGETLILTAGAGEVGQAMVAEGRTISFNHPRSIVALTARTGKGIIVNNVHENPDFLPHPLLPDTRSEMAVPMIVGDQLLGVFDVQADEVDRFTEDDRQIITTLAAQVAVALENVRLFAQVERALADVKIVQQQYIQQAWDQASQTQKRTYRYERSGFAPLAEEIRQKAKNLARQKKEPVLVTLDPDIEGIGQKSVVAPVSLSGATIGSLQLHLAEGQNEDQALDEDDLALLEVILEQVAQTAENLRLFDETRQRADYERLVGKITQKVRQSPSLEMLAQTAAEALSEVLDVPIGLVSLNVTSPQGTEKVGTNGQTKNAK